MLRRLLRSDHASKNRPAAACGGPRGPLPPGEAAGSAAGGTSSSAVDCGRDPAVCAQTLTQGSPSDLTTALPPVDPAAVEHAGEPSVVVDGPVTSEAGQQRARPERRRTLTVAGKAGMGLAALTLSAMTSGVLAAGTVQGPRSDVGRARPGQTSMIAGADVVPSVPDGRAEDVTAARESTISALRTVPEETRVMAAEEAAAVAAEQAAAQRAVHAQEAAAQVRQEAAVQGTSRSAARAASRSRGGDPRAIARAMLARRGWSGQWTCLNLLWQRESGWDYRATNRSSGAYGIPQALPGRKMASAGADWRTNPATQIRWGLGYIASVHRTPCRAWDHSRAHGWY